MHKLNIALGISLAAFAGAGFAAEADPALKKLDWLIGSWNFVDTEINGEYQEKGTRVCDYALDNHYILCESKGTSHTGRERTYLFYFNYNKLDERYEMTGLFGGFPRKIFYTLEVSENGHDIELDNNEITTEGIVRTSLQTITYNGKDQYVWNIRLGEPDPETGD
ncbi:MAG: hypothetical protein MJA83_17210, partial [Gammaproteobacteria bacterium]|nr:hypothetical protein [Gammaproteobacteria bacterium]